MSWFRQLTGFDEVDWDDTRSKLQLQGDIVASRVNGRSWRIGVLETPTLAELRERVRHLPAAGNGPVFRNRVSDARVLHAETSSRAALVQVASQFNLLEMTGPSVTPERGVEIYEHDPTQGPACAIAAGAATIFRNSFADTGQGLGQTATRQIDTLRELGLALVPEGIPMRNGYALPSLAVLRQITTSLRAADVAELDRLRGLLRIGLHWDVEVTQSGLGQGQLLSQAFCSAVPVSYSGISAREWELFARLVLEAAYEATLLAAVQNAARGGSRTVFLTMLGGGAFGNPREWIMDALRRALGVVAGHDLDVCMVSRGHVDADLKALAESMHSRAQGLRSGDGAGPAVAPSRLRAPRGTPSPPSGTQSAPWLAREAFAHGPADAAGRPHSNCYWLAVGRMLAGEYPGDRCPEKARPKLERILDAGVRRFIDLTEPRELEPYSQILAELAAERGIEVVHQRHPIVDMGVPSIAGMRAILDSLCAPHEGVTYLHCWGGIGRTGTVAGCLLIEAGYTAADALALIARKWTAMEKRGREPQSPQTTEQFAFVRNWTPRSM